MVSLHTARLTSATLATEYLLQVVALGDGPRRRLVLVLDGDDQFEAAHEAAQPLVEAGLTPPLLLVGVGYGGGYRSARNRRGRDYTPTRMSSEPSETGGAAAFHAFLGRELIPALAANYTFEADDLTVIGHSLGGLFVLYAAAVGGFGFRRFLAGSPSIWWDDRSILAAFSPDRMRTRPNPVQLFLSVGEDDTPSMTGDLTLLRQQLEQAPPEGLVFHEERFTSLDHYTALPRGFECGLRWLFRT